MAASCCAPISKLCELLGLSPKVVGSHHIGKNQLRGQDYMKVQAERTLESPVLRISGGPPLQWYCLNDIVMGGMSSSELRLTSSAIEFSGSINTKGGGFASCRTTRQEHRVPPGVTGVWLTVSGQHTHNVKFVMGAGSEADENDPTGNSLGVSDLDAERSRMNKGSSKGGGKGGKGTMTERWASMSPEERRGFLQNISWACTFSEQLAGRGSGDSKPRRFFLPLSSFSASLYGQLLPKLRSPDLSKLQYIGINVGIFDSALNARSDLYTDGPFKIALHSVEFA